jgi:hypothetical protein
LTPQQRMVLALNQADQTCMDGFCIHQKALQSIGKLLNEAIESYASDCYTHHRDPLVGSFEYGVHVGYRLAQLDQENGNEQEN